MVMVVGNVLHTNDGMQQYTFSSHMAAFEAMCRASDAAWKPLGRETYFNDDDKCQFSKLSATPMSR